MSKALSPRRRRNESFISRSVDEGQLADNDDSERLDKLLERLEPAPKSRRFFRKAAAVKKKNITNDHFIWESKPNCYSQRDFSDGEY